MFRFMLYRLISKFSRKYDCKILSTMKKNLTYEELFEANVRLQEENNVLLYTIRHFDADSDKVVSKEKELLRQTVRETLQIVVKA